MRANPHLCEINTRPWLNSLREKYHYPHTLSNIPEEEWLELKHLGFDAVWLMGVWATGPRGEQVARSQDFLKKELASALPGGTPEDIGSSPYAVFDYSLNPRLGGPEDLKLLHEKLNCLGLNLFLDFVPNHLAADHPFTLNCPDCFLQGTPEDLKSHPGLFFQSPGGAIIAYGRDPNFPPWTDTAQLNCFHPAARKELLGFLLKSAELCDGVRCDMVMLTINEVFENTWRWLLSRKSIPRPEKEFWPEAISAVREVNPRFVFLGEVYWGLEWQAQEMGFDFTYDKVLYDRLRYKSPIDVRGHLRAGTIFQKRSARFIENHDEAPALAAFGREKSLAAAVIISTLTGLRMYLSSQLDGNTVKVPVQLLRRTLQTDPSVRRFYEKLLKITDHPAFHGGEWTMIEPGETMPGDHSFHNLLCWSWTQRRTVKLVAVNYSPVQSRGRLRVNVSVPGPNFTVFDELSERFISAPAAEVRADGFLVDLPPFGVHIFDIEF